MGINKILLDDITQSEVSYDLFNERVTIFQYYGHGNGRVQITPDDRAGLQEVIRREFRTASATWIGNFTYKVL